MEELGWLEGELGQGSGAEADGDRRSPALGGGPAREGAAASLSGGTHEHMCAETPQWCFLLPPWSCPLTSCACSMLLASGERREPGARWGYYRCSLGKEASVRRAGRQAGRRRQQGFKAKSHLPLHAKGRRKTRGLLLRCSFLCSLRGENISPTQPEKPNACIYNMPIFVILESRFFFFFFLVSKGGEVMERNPTLTIN